MVSIPETDEQRRNRLGITEPIELLYNHAVELKTAGKFTAAAVAMRRAIGLLPNHPMLWNWLGAILSDLGDYQGSATALERAQSFGEDSAIFHSNLGLLASAQKQFEVAECHFADALKREPGNLHTKWNVAVSRLEAGDWARGLVDYEVRKEYLGTRKYPKMPFPTWTGEDLAGKTLYVQAEQGAGDRILFSRYLHWVKTRWPSAKIKFSCGDELMALFWKFFSDGICDLVPDNSPWPEADYGIFLMSLPLVQKATVDNVYPDPGLIRQGCAKLQFSASPPRNQALKVGIAWTGNPAQARNHERSIPFPLMLELEDNPNVQLYSLQFGAGQSDIRACGADQLITDLVPLIGPRGYIGTAAAILSLDLVITVCTSLAHLAGSLGVPCWTLLCHDPYWVWLREGDATAWYQNMKLFRQNNPGDWGPVIDRVKRELADFAQQRIEQPQLKTA